MGSGSLLILTKWGHGVTDATFDVEVPAFEWLSSAPAPCPVRVRSVDVWEDNAMAGCSDPLTLRHSPAIKGPALTEQTQPGRPAVDPPTTAMAPVLPPARPAVPAPRAPWSSRPQPPEPPFPAPMAIEP